jgi:hypothetical protein
MPILKDNRKREEILLPDSGIKVVVTDGLLAKDVEAMQGISNDFSQTIELITRLIFSWDAQDENGQVLPITKENVNLLTMNDLKKIQDSLSFVKDFLSQTAA